MIQYPSDSSQVIQANLVMAVTRLRTFKEWNTKEHKTDENKRISVTLWSNRLVDRWWNVRICVSHTVQLEVLNKSEGNVAYKICVWRFSYISCYFIKWRVWSDCGDECRFPCNTYCCQYNTSFARCWNAQITRVTQWTIDVDVNILETDMIK